VGNSERIGVYGGTFDPIHRTHLDVARAALEHAGLDRVIFVVSAVPPHKSNEVFASAEDRYAMAVAAVAEESGMSVSRVELNRAGPSYTAHTLGELHAEYPAAQLHLIVGGDSLADLPRWRDPEAIIRLARILVVPRPGASAMVPPLLAGRVDFLPFEESDVSSTEIRAAIARGEDTAPVLPAAVRTYIRAKGLYHAHS
jgi:nicotinate-nucleotide adenylyltransferase